MGKKTYTFYANCQGGAIAKTLEENQNFLERYERIVIKPIQNLRAPDIETVRAKIAATDVIIYQTISERGRAKELSSENVLKYAKPDAQLISIPSLYFDGYFPHLSSMNGHKSILTLVHDYFIAYAYCRDLSATDCLQMIQSKTLYSKTLSQQLFQTSLENLRRREQNEALDITVSGHIADKFKEKKLFNQFNHPTRDIIEFVSDSLLEKIGVDRMNYDPTAEGHLDGLEVPIYKSTYSNLGLQFTEAFNTYKTLTEQSISQHNIISAFYSFYDSLDKAEILAAIKKKKPFVIPAFEQFWA